MAVKDFVVKNGLQVGSNVVVGSYTNSANPIQNGIIVSGNVGIGTSAVVAGTRLEVQGGNVKLGTVGYGLVFPDGTLQTSAAVGTGPGGALGAIQYNNGTSFAGDTTRFYYDSVNARVGIGTAPPVNTLDVAGGVVIGASGTYAGVATAPTNGLFVQGQVGIGTTSTTGMAAGNAIAAFGSAIISGSIYNATWNGVTIAPTKGGTGLTAVTTGDVLYGSGTNTWSGLAIQPAGNVLISGSTPSWSKVGLTTHVTGTLGATNGGTGLASFAQYSLLYASAANTWSELAKVNTAALVTNNTGVPSWTAGTTANRVLRTDGSTISFAQVALGTDVSGTLPVGNGGTGLTSYAVGDIVYASGTTTLASLADVATGNVVISGGVGVAPSYGKVGLTTHVSGILPLANGGTNKAISVSNGGIVWTDADSMEVLSASATSGNVLLSGGAGTPSWGYSYTNTNIPSSIVSRDASGNFSAGTITATLVGNASASSNAIIVDNTTTNASWYPTFAPSAGTANINISTTKMTFNPSTGTLNSTVVQSGGNPTLTTATSFSNTAVTDATVSGAYNALALTLATVNTNVGTYGGTTQLPYFTVNAKGLVTAAGNIALSGVSVGTATNIAGGTTGQIPYQTGAGTTGFVGVGTASYALTGNGAASPIWTQYTASNTANTIVYRDGSGNFSAGTITAATGLSVSAGGINVTGYSSFTGNLSVTGNLLVSGNINTVNSNVLVVSDPIIYVGENNVGNAWDLGLVSSYTNSSYSHTGMVRNHNDGYWTFFDNLVTEPTQTIDWAQIGLRYADVKVGNINVASTIDSTTTSTGAIITLGGMGIAKALNVGTNGTFGGDIAINGGDITTTQLIGNVFNATATTVNFAGAASALNMGANTGTLTIGNPTVVGTQATQALYNTTATTMSFAGAATTLNMGANSGTLTVGNPTVVGTQATQALYNTTATTMNFAGAATALNMGANTGTLTIGNPTVVGTQATQALYNTTATTMNFAGAATALNMGAATGTAQINNANLTLGNATTFNMNGANPTIAGTSTGTLTLFNTNLTAVNAFGAATSIALGANTGTLTIGNPTVVGTQVTQALYNTTATTMNFAGAATALNMGAATGTAQINNANLTLGNATVLNVNGANPTIASTSTGTLTLFNTNLATVNAFGAATTIGIGANTGTTTFNSQTISTSSTTGAVKVAGGIGIAGNLNVAGTQNYFTNAVGVGTTSNAGIVAGNIIGAFGNVYVSGAVYANNGVITPSITANTITQTYTVDVTGTYTTGAAVTQVVIDSFAGATYRAAEYQISMKQGTSYAISRITVIHDGTTAYLVEYDSATTSGFLVDYDANYNAGTIELRAAPRVATITEFKISRKLWVV